MAVMSLMLILSINCNKEVRLPTISTIAVSQVTNNSAVSGGNITTDGGAAVAGRGLVWNTGSEPTLEVNTGFTTEGSGVGVFPSSITGLVPITKYNVRAYATNSAGTVYGKTMVFTTLGDAPVTITQPATNITEAAATLNAVVNANNVPTVVTFEYGTTQAYRNSIAAIQSEVSGDISTDVSAEISGLSQGTLYHFRIKAVSSLGTFYSGDLSFISLPADKDGNVYNYAIIGTQVWMRENLKTTVFNDGTPIPLVTDSIEWNGLYDPAYCWYNNDAGTYKDTYGALYNWFTVNTGKLCPAGWHEPFDADWAMLTTYLGGVSVSAVKLKETGTDHWPVPNTEATNESGFTALPGGSRIITGYGYGFRGIGMDGNWWSNSNRGSIASISGTTYSFGVLDGGAFGKHFGLSVRCLMDN